MIVKRVRLKEKSPEFAEDRPRRTQTRHCDMPDCRESGEFKAPRDRSLASHYWFCQQHILDYNAAWDFFSGMSQTEIEHHMRQSLFGDRPTWTYTTNPTMADDLRAQANRFRDFKAEERQNTSQKQKTARAVPASPEQEALAIMGLETPVTLDEIKTRYKKLDKTYHPDLNHGNREAEDTLKKVNMAYTVLKLAYQRYEENIAAAE